MIGRAVLALLLTTSVSYGQSQQGKYTVVPNTNGVWIVDTWTGESKFCFPRRNDASPTGYEVICTAPAK